MIQIQKVAARIELLLFHPITAPQSNWYKEEQFLGSFFLKFTNLNLALSNDPFFVTCMSTLVSKILMYNLKFE